MDKFVVRYKTSDEALPLAWKTLPLPKSTPKRPVGRPQKRKLEIDDSCSSSKRQCPEKSVSENETIEEIKTCVKESSRKSNTESVSKECKTLDNAAGNSESSGATKERNIRGHYKHFSLKEKLEVVQFSKVHGIRGAAKHFKIPKSSILNWTKSDYSSILRDKSGCLPKSGRPLTYPEELDQKILEYVLEQRDLQNAVSIEDICIYAAEIIKPVSPGFAASRRWAASFMKPMIIFKGKRELSMDVPKGWIVTVQEKGWMDENLMLRWIRDIYLKYTKKERSLLVLDSFRGHLTDNVKKAFRKGNTVMAVIPGGCTSKVQPLDVSINKPFKTELRKSWKIYMRDSAKIARESGARVKAASKEEVVSWIVSAVSSIQAEPELIMCSFLACGISNTLNGSEDYLIRKESSVEKKDYQGKEHCDPFDSESDCDEFEGFDPEDIPQSLEELQD